MAFLKSMFKINFIFKKCFNAKMNNLSKNWTMLKKCPYLDIFWSVFPLICTEYGRMREKTDQNNSKYGYFYAAVVVEMILGSRSKVLVI